MTYEEAEKYYWEHFPVEMKLEDVLEGIEKLEGTEIIDGIRTVFCNTIINVICGGYVKYDANAFEKNELVAAFINQAERFPKDYYIYKALSCYFKGDNKNVIQNLKKMLKTDFSETVITEGDFVQLFWELYKQGFDGFWDTIYKELKQYQTEDGVLELCKFVEDYYKCASNEEVAEKLSIFVHKHPNLSSPKELLGSTYQELGMWRNSIACLETVEMPVLLYKDDLLFMMGWAYGKCKERKKEEECYRKCLELAPDAISAMNNLAYSLYLQKRYIEAKEILEQCLEEDRDLPYSANNYLRVLIALGRNKDAKAFLKSTKHKIYKTIRDRVQKLDNTNARLKKTDYIALHEELPEEEAISTKGKAEAKKQQFTSEKLLEDELTARLEAGLPVFGKNLKIYRRFGVYGRQFIIPIGRLDLLCEDEKGDLYIIELKKDSGYDDVYKQTSDYLDWFESDEISKGKKVYGIICLNSPTEQLIQKVKKDPRMKLYEYQISYREL